MVVSTLLVVAPATARRALGTGEDGAPHRAILVACGLQLAAAIAVLGPRPRLLRRADGKVSWRAVGIVRAALVGAALALTEHHLGWWLSRSTFAPGGAVMCAAQPAG